MAGDVSAEVERLRKLVLDTVPGTPLAVTDGYHWFKATTARIDRLKAVEDQLSENLASGARAMQDEAADAVVLWTLAAFAVLAATSVLALSMAHLIARPLTRLAQALTAIAHGEDVPLTVSGTGEVGQIAAAAQEFQASMRERQRLAESQKALTEAGATERQALLARMADEFETTVGGIVTAVAAAAGELEGAAQGMTGEAKQAASQAGSVAEASKEAAESVNMVSRAAEELSASIQEVSGQVETTASIASKP